jgi:hypothetical protein
VLAHAYFDTHTRDLTARKSRTVTATSRVELKRELRDADAVLIHFTQKVDAQFLDQAPRLRVLATFSVGLDHIDLNECRRRRIRVVHTPGVLTRATAEQAMALLLACARRTAEGDRLCRRGRGWKAAPDFMLGQGLHGRRALIVGVDRVKMAATCKVWATMTLGALANGTKLYIDNVADVETEQLGAHWMDGSNLGYAYGGFGIDPTGTFAEQVPDALLTHAIMHRANVARQFLAAYDLDTGQPIGLDDWTSPPNPALMMGEPNMSSRVELQPFLVGDYYTYRYPHFNEGTCKYEFARTATVAGAPTLYLGLWDYETHDVAHSVRAFRNPIQLVEFTKDPAARDDILMFAEVNRYGWFSDRPDERTRAKNPSDGYWATTLTSTREALASSAHQGGWFDRNWAWSAFAGACAIAYDNNPQRVAGWKAWGRDMLDTTSLAVDKFGFTGRTYSPGNFPANVGGIQTFHEMLVMTHRITLAGQVFDKIPTELAAINRRGLMSALAVFAPRAYGDSVGPPHWIGTIDNGHELPVSVIIRVNRPIPQRGLHSLPLLTRKDLGHSHLMQKAHRF